MDRLLDVDTFIKDAKKRGIEFGKGNPYNRLRYYTKIGLLPHMIRKKEDGDNNIKGHYHESVLDRLEYIEQQKKTGMTNEEIFKLLDNKVKSKQFSTWISSPEILNQFIKYGTFVLVLFVLLAELGVVRIGAYKQDLINVNPTDETSNIVTINESGNAFMPENRNSIFVKANTVNINSKIYVAFKGDYSPAIRYWIADIVDNAGFYVQLDSPTYSDTPFDWWVSN